MNTYKFEYDSEDILEEGSFGKVYVGKYYKTGNFVAIKVIENYKPDPDYYKEIQNFRNLSGENIVRLIDFEVIERNAYLIMELCEGNMREYISFIRRKFTDSEIQDFIRQTTSGLKIIHNKQMVHGDIKPKNILFVRKGNKITFKLLFLAASKLPKEISYIDKTIPYDKLEFMAPEVRVEIPANKSTDIWSLGKTICFMISRNIRDLEYEKRTKGRLKNLLSKMLDINFCERITVDQILNHSFLDVSSDSDEFSLKNNFFSYLLKE